ncbi:MAG: hypothetical protein R3C26_24345 [Calditrichia bacterium]
MEKNPVGKFDEKPETDRTERAQRANYDGGNNHEDMFRATDAAKKSLRLGNKRAAQPDELYSGFFKRSV